jgi:RNA polymerase sigma-70 factor (ECF subfamily)
MDRWHLPRDPLLALQAGDPAPFEELVRAHSRTMIAYFRQRGASRGRAEDLSQELFLKLYRGAARYRPEERFSAFCFRVARNLWVDECRRSGVRHASDEALPLELAAEVGEPGAELLGAEEEALVSARLAVLPPAHREVFELAVLGELGYAEIGALLGIPEGTVKSRMFYAVRRLRLAWPELGGEEGVA